MANITITIPDNKVIWAIDALCDWGQYDEHKLQAETKGQFAKRMVALKVKEITAQYITKVKRSEKDAEVLLELEGLDIT